MGQIKNIKLHIVTDIKINIPPLTMGEDKDTIETKKPIFRDLTAEDDDVPEITEIESMCMSCEENGTTRLLLTKIPFFRDVIIMSFTCPHCGYRDNQIQPGSDIEEKGVRLTLKVEGSKMMNRQIVKQGSASVLIKELEFEAPAFTSKGSLTTVEGILENAAAGLEEQQPVRRIMQPEIAEKIDEVIGQLTKYRSGEVPFTVVLEDITGNSFIENPFAPQVDPAITIERFTRTKEQDEQLGMTAPEEDEAEKKKEEEELLNQVEEVIEFGGNCEACQTPTPIRMKVVNIPHFKEVILMASSCDACGHKTNEVKAGGAMEAQGSKIIFKMSDPTDLARDVLAAESCTISIPDFELSVSNYANGGRFTTLEGLLVYVTEQLGRTNPFAFGDSADKATKLKELVDNMNSVIAGERFVTLILDDPVGNSYLQNTYAPDPDPNLIVEEYERTEEQDIELGIKDMKTEDYEDD